VHLPAGAENDEVAIEVTVSDSDDALVPGPVPLTWTRRSALEDGRQDVDLAVCRPAAVLDGAVARRKALELNQAGKTDDAGKVIDGAVALMRAMAAGDSTILACAQQLEDEREQYARPMSALHSKLAHVQAQMLQKQKSMGGSFGSSSSPSSSSAAASGGLRALSTSPRLASSLKTAVKAFAGLQGLGGIDVDVSPQTSPPQVLAPSDEQRLLSALRPAAAFTVVFVEEALQDGWFSHWHANHRTVVVSCAGVVALTGVPQEAFIAYELLFHGLRTQSARYDPLQMAHPDSRGCLFDLCADKAELVVKLQAGHICSDCERKLAVLGIDASRVARLWSAVQALAHPGPGKTIS
jgi:hypothetical protein